MTRISINIKAGQDRAVTTLAMEQAWGQVLDTDPVGEGQPSTTTWGLPVLLEPNHWCCLCYSCTTNTTPTWWERRTRSLKNTSTAATSTPGASPTWPPPLGGQPSLCRRARGQVSWGDVLRGSGSLHKGKVIQGFWATSKARGHIKGCGSSG